MERALFSTDYWLSLVSGQETGHKKPEMIRMMLRALKEEIPQMCSVTMERSCNLQCSHCIYPRSPSNEAHSREILPGLVRRAVEQLPGKNPRLLHEGRTLRAWHVELMSDASRYRPGLEVGLIDNGTYTRHIDAFARAGFKLDWLDISVDGDEQAHNAQRRSARAYHQAMEGLKRARNVTKERVASLFTLTTINHASLEAAAQALFEPLGREALVDEMHISTITPSKAQLLALEQHDLSIFWQQAKAVFKRYGKTNGKQRVFFRLYRHQEIAKLARATSGGEVLEALRHALLAPGEIYFTLRGIPFIYAPLSIWPGETFLIDADGAYRTAYSIGETLSDLQRGWNDDGRDLRGYTVEILENDFNLRKAYRQCVDQWWRFAGKNFFREEMEIIDNLG